MADFAVSTVRGVLLDAIKRQIGYAFKFRSKVDALRREIRYLRLEREGLLESIEVAQGRGEVVKPRILDWKDQADTLIADAEEVVRNGEETAQKSCSICLNLNERYRLGKTADLIKQGVVLLLAEKVSLGTDSSSLPALQQIVERPPLEGHEAPSGTQIRKEVIDALSDPNITMVGLYGMGGIGKTFLAKQVYRQAINESLFHKVIIAKAETETRAIQDKIADFIIGSKLEESSNDDVRATELNWRLNEILKEKNILIILDDIRSELDLDKVGIPTDNKNCKIMLTSRRLDLLSYMGSETNFLVGVLSEEDSISLREKKLTLVEDGPLKQKKMAGAFILDMAEGIMEKLGSQEMMRYRGLESELLMLAYSVSTILDVLPDAEEKSFKSGSVIEWLQQLGEVMCDTDDLMDVLVARSLQRKLNNKVAEVCLFFSSSNMLVYGLKMAPRLRDLRSRLNNIAARGTTEFHLRVLPPIPVEEHRLPPFYPPEILFGREGDKDAILKALLSEKEERSVETVAIVGMGGMGKTALAKMVYRDETVARQFGLRLWINVGDGFDLGRIVEKIVKQFTHESIGGIGMKPLVAILRETIKATRFLLVLDDVWDTDEWHTLEDILRKGVRGSKILITTRIAKIAGITFPTSLLWLEGLTENDSWSLLKNTAFAGREVPSSQGEFRQEIIGKCRGSPMAIKLIGSLLYFKPTDSEWFSSRRLWMMEDGVENHLYSVIRLCSRDLPSHLKRCFALCSLFPKDSTIHVPRLINLWIAQGCVKPSGLFQSLEAIGIEYFRQLVWRSFFIDVVEDGDMISCRIPDLLHDLAAKMLFRSGYVFSPGESNSMPEEVVHASFHVDPTKPWEVPLHLFDARKVRSLLLLNETRISLGAVEPGCQLEKQQLDGIASNFRWLEMLDLHSSNISKVPKSVCNLKFLTYLDLSENENIMELPDSITRLLLLETLKLDNCSRLMQLPKDTKMLVSLVHLGVENCNFLTHIPRGIGRLTSLSTLSRFVLSIDRSISKYSANLGELQDLNDLRGTLRIYNLPHSKGAMSEFEAANLKAKKSLLVLRLEWSDGYEDHNDHDRDAEELGDDKMAMQALQPHLGLERLELRGYRGTEFPDWLSSLTNLVALDLESCEMCKWLPPLHKLIHLKSLTIEGLTTLTYVEDREIKGGNYINFFTSLEKLVLSNCPKLEGWWKPAAPTTSPSMEFPCFSCVKQLSITACPKLSSNLMPGFPSLNSVKFSDCSMTILKQILVQTKSSASTSASSSSSTRRISQLEALEIEAINDLESFPEDLFQNLESLQTFRVSRCRRLKALFEVIRHLKSLTTISIEDCRKLDLCSGDGGTQRQVLERLRSVTIDRIPELVSLPRWIQHLTLLERLEISGCHNLQSLPEWMTELHGLRLLIIIWCPQLTDNCQRDTGEDWPKIKHIPGIIVNRKAV